MGEPIIDPKALEEALAKALKSYFRHTPEVTNNPRIGFYNRFQREADEHDSDFVKKCGGDLDTTLIFAGLFSAVASAFILAVQTQLQPDYTQLSHDILRVFAESNGLKLPPRPDSDTPWTGPDPTLVRVQAILFSSLAVSLLASFGAMLGKQWLNRYSRVDMHGSLIDRSRDRQRKMDGMTIWHFDLVMEILPLMLQAALLLLGCALTSYLITIDHLIAWVVGGFTASGFLYYLLIVVAATLSYNCPYQTPPSLIVHYIIRYDRERGKYLKRAKRWLRGAFSRARKQRIGTANGVYQFGTSTTPDGKTPGDHIELSMWGPYDNSQTPFEKETDWEGYVLDSNCIAWMFKMSTDEDVIQDIMKFIPEVVWHPGIQTAPLEKLYDIVVDCLDRTPDRPVVIPKLKKKAYLTAKAFVHLAIQRKCIGDQSDKAVFESISRRHAQNIGSRSYGDSDLDSTLRILDRVLGVSQPEPMGWEGYSFSDSHHAWMSHILLYRAWYALERNGTLPDDVTGFVLYSLRLEPSSPPKIISDCLHIISLVLGVTLDNDDQAVDKGHRFRPQINKIYTKLVRTFRNPNSPVVEIDRAMEAMRLIAPLSENDIAIRSYELFRGIMRAHVTSAYTEEKKWEASRLALHGAYKWDKVLPWVEDPQDILAFLNYHFELVAAGENHDEPIQNAMRALAYASTATTRKALDRFNPAEPSFIKGICFAFQDERPLGLRKAALFFLPLIADAWFNTPTPIMTSDEMQSFSADWASAVDEAGSDKTHIQGVALTVLFDMVNSSHWRPCIVSEKWKLLEYFASVPEDCKSLRRCLDNPEIMQAISDTGDQTAMVLWSATLWLRYKELSPEVRTQLEAATKGAQKWGFDSYLSVINAELTNVEDALTEFNTWSTDSTAVALRARIDDLKTAKEALVRFRRF